MISLTVLPFKESTSFVIRSVTSGWANVSGTRIGCMMFRHYLLVEDATSIPSIHYSQANSRLFMSIALYIMR